MIFLFLVVKKRKTKNKKNESFRIEVVLEKETNEKTKIEKINNEKIGGTKEINNKNKYTT